MKINFPTKSLFGFKVLNSIQSVLTAYFLLISYYIIKPYLGTESIKLLAASLFILILNLSIIILSLNSIKQKPNKDTFIWLIYNLPLWIYIPISLEHLTEVIRVIKNYI